jgi:hypothetical protein
MPEPAAPVDGELDARRTSAEVRTAALSEELAQAVRGGRLLAGQVGDGAGKLTHGHGRSTPLVDRPLDTTTRSFPLRSAAAEL